MGKCISHLFGIRIRRQVGTIAETLTPEVEWKPPVKKTNTATAQHIARALHKRATMDLLRDLEGHNRRGKGANRRTSEGRSSERGGQVSILRARQSKLHLLQQP